MADSNTRTAEDDSLLSRIERSWFKLEKAAALGAGSLILLMVLFSVINIVGRGIFNKPFNAYFDLMGQSVPVIAFLGVSYCHRLGDHIRMDILVGALKGRLLWGFELFTTLLSFLVVTALAYGAWLHTERALQIGDSTEDIGMPIWPIKALIVVMFVMLSLRMLLHSWGYARLLVNPNATPIAIPLVETPEQQAEREAKTVSGSLTDKAS